MGRSSNLELNLDSTATTTAQLLCSPDSIRQRSEECSANSNLQQLTIFYNGQVRVCNVTEVQARAILCLAKRETEEQMNWKEPSSSTSNQQAQTHIPALSMKKSLQKFLQKRRSRIRRT